MLANSGEALFIERTKLSVSPSESVGSCHLVPLKAASSRANKEDFDSRWPEKFPFLLLAKLGG